MATYAGRVWIGNARTVTYSAPGSYTDFTIASAGGSFIVTDESLHSNIYTMMANNNYLYIFGNNAINVISDVRVATTGATAGLTQFSNNNITNSVGTSFPFSLISYDRSVLFANSYGFHGIFGATVKKASDKLDGLFPYIDTTHPITGGLALLFNNIVPTFLFQYLDPENGGSSRALMACLRDGKWFFTSQTDTLTSLCGCYIGDSPALFATTGSAIYRLFTDSTADIATKARTALMHFEEPWTDKQAHKLAIELNSTVPLSGTAIMQTEIGQSATVAKSTATFVWTGYGGLQVKFFNTLGDQVDFYGAGRQVFQGDVQTYGRYLGAQWTSTSPNYTLNGFMLQFKNTSQWGSLPNAGI